MKLTTISPSLIFFSDEAQIDSTFVQLIFDSNEPTNLDRLIEDLVIFCNANETRLLDLLFVTGNFTRLLDEQKIRGAPYDIYDAEVKDRLDFMTTYDILLSNSDVKQGDPATSLAMTLSMLATIPMFDAASYTWLSISACPGTHCSSFDSTMDRIMRLRQKYTMRGLKQ
ncbi:hypothetical protein PENTCL1PPCAC_1525, partial [Pristionchus entomophagus]